MAGVRDPSAAPWPTPSAQPSPFACILVHSECPSPVSPKSLGSAPGSGRTRSRIAFRTATGRGRSGKAPSSGSRVGDPTRTTDSAEAAPAAGFSSAAAEAGRPSVPANAPLCGVRGVAKELNHSKGSGADCLICNARVLFIPKHTEPMSQCMHAASALPLSTSLTSLASSRDTTAVMGSGSRRPRYLEMFLVPPGPTCPRTSSCQPRMPDTRRPTSARISSRTAATRRWRSEAAPRAAAPRTAAVAPRKDRTLARLWAVAARSDAVRAATAALACASREANHDERPRAGDTQARLKNPCFLAHAVAVRATPCLLTSAASCAASALSMRLVKATKVRANAPE